MPADVDPDTIVNLGIFYAPAVTVFAILSVWSFSRFALTREEHQGILEELRARRS